MEDINAIIDVLANISATIVDRIQNNTNRKYYLITKQVKHSDVISGGKRTDKKHGFERYVLNYLSITEMEAAGSTPVAHQSNFIIPSEIYDRIGFKKAKGRKLNESADVYIVNDSVCYFSYERTLEVVQALGKRFPWIGGDTFHVEEGLYTPISMTHGDQGVGTGEDKAFMLLRRNIFLDDTIHFLVEQEDGKKDNLFIILERNEKYYSILGLDIVKTWSIELIKRQQEIEKLKAGGQDKLVEAKQRSLQAAWKKQLAIEMMQLTHNNSVIFCPFTRIESDYNKTPMLFIASHIKRHADSDIHEKYDINNGLLLIANADALFDKHMITVSEDKKLIFSCLLKEDTKLIENLKLNQQIFVDILNDQRMKFMEDHRRIFFEKELERQKEDYVYDEYEEEEEQDTFGTFDEGISREEAEVVPINYSFDENLSTKVAQPVISFEVLDKMTYSRSCSIPKTEGAFLLSRFNSPKHKTWIINNKKYLQLNSNDATKDHLLNDVALFCLYDEDDTDSYMCFDVRRKEDVNKEFIDKTDCPNIIRSANYTSLVLQRNMSIKSINIGQILNETSEIVEDFTTECSILIK